MHFTRRSEGVNCKSSELKIQYNAKVNVFLREALGEENLFRKSKLLGKAVYWNMMAMKSDPDIKLKRGKPMPPNDGFDQMGPEQGAHPPISGIIPERQKP